MSIEIQQPSLAPQIGSLLSGLRRRIRQYVWVQGLALAVAWLGTAFWITLVLDWWIEPPALARQIMIGGVAAVLVYLIYRFILRRAFVRLADGNLAVLLERRFDKFGDSLLTTVELAEQPGHSLGFNPRMLAHTQSEAIRHLPEVRLADIFRRGPLVRALVGAAAAVVSVAAFALLASGAFKIWVDRDLLFSDVLWPRRVHLAVDGFPDKRLKIAKGSDVTIIAKADTRYEVPETAQIRYRTEEGKSRENMSRLGVAAAGDEYQLYSFVFRGILSSRSFDVVGGDMALRDYQIDVVDVPTIEMTLRCVYPEYMHRESRDLPVTGLVQLPQGTKITVQAKANKDLVDVPVSSLVADKTQPGRTIHLADSPDRRRFTYQIERLDDDETLLFTLVDTDGIRTKDPVRLNLNAIPDEAPRVGVHLRAISTSITPQARLPIEGEITDDYGVSKLWFEYKLDQADPVRVSFRTNPHGHASLKFDRAADEALDFKEQPLKIGQQMVLTMTAQDNCTLKQGPNVAASERYLLAIVAPEQLMSMLEARELTLRLRLEQIAQDLTATRDQLAQLDFAPPTGSAPSEKPVDKNGADKNSTAKKAAGDKPVAKPPAGAEPEDGRSSKSPASGAEPGDTNDRAPNRGLNSAPVVIEQTLANSERGASETASLSTAFDDIRDEMTNNRIETPELEYRLKDQIADPLRRIAETMFPELDRRLKKLEGTLADPGLSKTRHEAALQQVDAILVEMRQVMNKMLELESFNEIVEHLREIIKAQDDLNKLTQKRQKEKALKLND